MPLEHSSTLPENSSPQASRARPLRRLLALALGIAVALLAVEGGARFMYWRAGKPYDGARAEMELDAFIERLKGLNFVAKGDGEAKDPDLYSATLTPYGGFQVVKSWEGIDALRAYFASDDAQKAYDVLLLGGSVAAEFSNWGRRALAPVLEEDPRLAGRPIRLLGRACAASKQPQTAIELEWILSLGVRPDVVVVLDGFNELAVAADNAVIGVHPTFPWYYQMRSALSGALADPRQLEIVVDIHEVRRSAERLAGRARSWGMMRSAVLGRFVRREFASLQSRSDALSAKLKEVVANKEGHIPLFLRGPDFRNEPDYVREMCVRVWLESSRSMQAVCRARGIHFVHVLQPSARDPGSKPLSEEEKLASWKPEGWRLAIEHGYPRLREAGAQLVSEGVNFHDASQVFADHPETVYEDMCHFGEDGCRIIGRFIGRAILESWPKE